LTYFNSVGTYRCTLNRTRKKINNNCIIIIYHIVLQNIIFIIFIHISYNIDYVQNKILKYFIWNILDFKHAYLHTTYNINSQNKIIIWVHANTIYFSKLSRHTFLTPIIVVHYWYIIISVRERHVTSRVSSEDGWDLYLQCDTIGNVPVKIYRLIHGLSWGRYNGDWLAQ